MDRNEINKHTRMIGTAARALTGFYSGLLEGSANQRKAAATVFRKAIAEKNNVTLGQIATLANNVLQALPALEKDGKDKMVGGIGSDTAGVKEKSKSVADFYTYAGGCESTRVAEGARSKCESFLRDYRLFRDVEATGEVPAIVDMGAATAERAEKATTV